MFNDLYQKPVPKNILNWCKKNIYQFEEKNIFFIDNQIIFKATTSLKLITKEKKIPFKLNGKILSLNIEECPNLLSCDNFPDYCKSIRINNKIFEDIESFPWSSLLFNLKTFNKNNLEQNRINLWETKKETIFKDFIPNTVNKEIIENIKWLAFNDLDFYSHISSNRYFLSENKIEAPVFKFYGKNIEKINELNIASNGSIIIINDDDFSLIKSPVAKHLWFSRTPRQFPQEIPENMIWHFNDQNKDLDSSDIRKIQEEMKIQEDVFKNYCSRNKKNK